MKIKTTIATVAVLATMVTGVSIPVSAATDTFRLGHPGYAGSGCPASSADITLTPDGKALTVLFDEYEVEVGGTSGRSSKRKKCDLSIPIHVPNGWSVSLVDADYRGYVDLPRGAKATLKRDYFFAGTQGPSLRSNWYGTKDKDYFVRDRLGLFASVWSRCGVDVNLRAKTSLKVRTRANREASAGVDSVDFNGRIVYHFRTKHC